MSFTSGNYGKTCLTEMNWLQEYLFGLFGAGSERNGLFPSFPLPLCETESSRAKIMHMKMCFTNTFITTYIRLICIWNVQYGLVLKQRYTWTRKWSVTSATVIIIMLCSLWFQGVYRERLHGCTSGNSLQAFHLSQKSEKVNEKEYGQGKENKGCTMKKLG